MLPTYLRLIIVCGGLCCAFFGKSTAQAPSPRLSSLSKVPPDALQADIDSLARFLEDAHPNLYAFTTPEELEAAFAHVRKQSEDSLTAIEFYHLVNPIIVSLGDIHSRILLPLAKNEYAIEGGFYLDMRVRYLNGKLYLMEGTDSVIAKGSQLINVNGFSINEITKSMLGSAPTDGTISSSRERMMEVFFKGKLPLYIPVDSLNQVSFIPYQESDTQTVTVEGIKRWPPPPPMKKRDRPSAREVAEEMFTLEYLEEGRVARMKVRSFSASKTKLFERFMKASFKEINEQKTETLIIDLRGNTGGKLYRGKRLMSYLADSAFYYTQFMSIKGGQASKNRLRERIWWPGLTTKLFPKALGAINMAILDAEVGVRDTIARNISWPEKPERRFKGNVYLLIDGLSISNSCIFTYAFRRYGIGQVIGVPGGGTETGTFGNTVPFTLPNTSLAGYLATIRIHSDSSMAYVPYGLQPNYLVPDRLEDLVEEKDTQLDFALKLIREARALKED
ncbi:MAG: S41 family peptidase [Bacteroidota bacterium]